LQACLQKAEQKQKRERSEALDFACSSPTVSGFSAANPSPQNENEIENEYVLEINNFLETKLKPHVLGLFYCL